MKIRGKLQIEIFPQICFEKNGEDTKIREMCEKELNGIKIREMSEKELNGTGNNNNTKSSGE